MAALCAAFSPDESQIITGGGDYLDGSELASATIKIWNATNGELEQTIVSIPSHSYENYGEFVRDIAVSPDGQYLFYHHIEPYNMGYPYYMLDYHVYPLMINTSTWEPISPFVRFGYYYAFSPIKDYFAASNGDKISIYDYINENLVIDIPGRSGAEYAFSSDARLLAAGSPKNEPARDTAIWDVETGDLVAVLGNKIESAELRSWSPDGKWLFTYVFKEPVRVWDVSHITQPAGVEEWEKMGRK